MMRGNDMVRYATIGTSWITDSFIEATKRVDGLTHVAVYSRDRKNAEEFANKHQVCVIFNDLNEMACSDEFDAVYVASPNAFHFEQSKLLLEHHKHVICEKPITCSKEEAEELFAIANKNHVVFMEAIMALHSPQVELLKKATEQIGRISLVRFDYSQLSSKYPKLLNGENPNIFNIDMKTGCIMDIGIYCVYLALHLFPDYINLKADAVKLPTSLDLCGVATLEYPDKLVTLSYSKIGNGRTSSEIQGDKGSIIIDKVALLNKISICDNDGTTKQIFEADPHVLSMQYEAQSFYDYITDFDNHKEKYEYLSNLSINVSDTLYKIRKASGVNF